MIYDDYLKHAWSLYYNAVDAEGDDRQRLLQQAEQVLENVPEGYKNRDDLAKRIKSMKK